MPDEIGIPLRWLHIASMATFRSGMPVNRALKKPTLACFGVRLAGGVAAALTW